LLALLVMLLMCAFQVRSLLMVTPHSKDLIEDIEQVQKRAARFVYNNYRSKEPGCVTNMLDTLNWEPLSQRRAKKQSHHAIQDH
jgi:hypothetical protein